MRVWVLSQIVFWKKNWTWVHIKNCPFWSLGKCPYRPWSRFCRLDQDIPNYDLFTKEKKRLQTQLNASLCCQGVWKPRKIANPAFFEDLQPFKMTPFSALGLELWSMTSDIFFDNFFITDDRNTAERWANDGWGLKKAAEGAAEVSEGRVDLKREVFECRCEVLSEETFRKSFRHSIRRYQRGTEKMKVLSLFSWYTSGFRNKIQLSLLRATHTENIIFFFFLFISQTSYIPQFSK